MQIFLSHWGWVWGWRLQFEEGKGRRKENRREGKEVTCRSKACSGKWRKAGRRAELVRKLGVGERKNSRGLPFTKIPRERAFLTGNPGQVT